MLVVWQLAGPPVDAFQRSKTPRARSVLQSHLEGVFKSALTSGSLALAGDVLAQLLTSRGKVPGCSHCVTRKVGLLSNL